MSNINKEQILKHLQIDQKAAEVVKKQWDIKRRDWIDETYGNPYGNEVKGKSQIVSKDIKKQVEWLIPSMTDPFISTLKVIKCDPITFEDEASARQSEMLLNMQFCRQFPRYNFINKAARVLATEGTLVIQTGWDYEEEVVTEEVEVIAVDDYGNQFIQLEEQEVTKVIKNQPTAVVCRNEDIYIDPTCMDDMDKCQFIVHRYETDFSTLKSDGRYKNLKRVMHNETRDDTDFVPEDETRFNFEDKARKKLVVHEYWGNYDINGDGIAEPIVCAWVGNTIIRLEDNPYPDNKPPFIVVPFNSVPFQMQGEALAENIGDNQKVKTAITRGIIDNMAQSNNGVVGVRKGAMDLTNRKKFLQGKNFEFNGSPNDFWQGSYNPIPGSAFDMLGLMNNDIEAQTGVKSFSGGISGATLGSTATAARGAMDATAMRRSHLVKNFAENGIKPLMRKWLAYDSEFLEEEEVVRVTNEEFVTIRKDDLGGKVDIDISISTREDNEAKVQQLSFLLQTLGSGEDPAIRRQLMSDIYELSRMPEEAKRMREYQPEPDPMQEKALRKVDLENAKLEAEIRALEASAGEDEMDAKAKEAKMMVDLAKARKLESDADRVDLDYVEKDNGFREQYDSQEKDKDRMHQVRMAEIQKILGGPNEQIGVQNG